MEEEGQEEEEEDKEKVQGTHQDGKIFSLAPRNFHLYHFCLLLSWTVIDFSVTIFYFIQCELST